MTIRLLLALLFLGVLPRTAHAQSAAADSAALARVIAHIDAAHFDSARSALAAWQSTRGAAARPSERGYADLLGARLERDGVAAQHAWLSLAMAHPFGPDAGLALLRVGQATLLLGDTASAAVYLNRLIDDFPGSGHTAEAYLWLARTHALAGRYARACTAARSGLSSAGSSEVIGLLRLQQQNSCDRTDRSPDQPADQPAARTGSYAVQSGAFRTRSGADALMGRLRAAGYQPRLVRVPANDLMRVRVGAFGAAAAASELRDRLRGAGFDAVVVDDAPRESPVD